jgi:hypothetical protein
VKRFHDFLDKSPAEQELTIDKPTIQTNGLKGAQTGCATHVNLTRNCFAHNIRTVITNGGRRQAACRFVVIEWVTMHWRSNAKFDQIMGHFSQVGRFLVPQVDELLRERRGAGINDRNRMAVVIASDSLSKQV